MSALSKASLAAVSLVGLIACPASDNPPAKSPTSPPVKRSGGSSSKYADSSFMKIRALLKQSPDAQARAIKLYPLIDPICRDEKARGSFMEVAQWSAAQSEGDFYLTKTLAADVIEHVVTACFRNHQSAAHEILEDAKKIIPDTYRFDLIRARLLATLGDFEKAEAAATTAYKNGSIHALALTANIKAQRARDAEPGYRTGMLDEAIELVNAKPTGEWMLIDVTAVLSTRARLLSERAVWEKNEQAAQTTKLANAVYVRLADAPFIDATRRRAHDTGCFGALSFGLVDGLCEMAATRTHALGAARVLKVATDKPPYDLQRLAQLDALKADFDAFEPGQVVVFVARGDESELLEWARPAARLLGAIAAKKPKLVVVDRTQSPRATALVQRMLAMAGAKSTEWIDAKKSTFAMPCLTALLASRRRPTACPIEPAQEKRLRGLGKYAHAFLVGRDLDAEIDDLRLYELPATLLSFRESKMEKGLSAWMKSVTDVFIIAPPTK